jgi:acetyl esterase/lipase
MQCKTLCVVALWWMATANPGIAREPAKSSDAPLTILHNLPYRDPAQKQCALDLAMPKDRAVPQRPAIVVIHGGGWIEGDKSSFASDEHGVPGNIVEFARLGFVAVTINYRLSREAPFPAALDDCRAAVRWLRAHADEYRLDSKRIGAYGNSAGGHLALLLAMMPPHELAASEPNSQESSLVQAAVSDSGPIDLTWRFDQATLGGVISRFMRGPPEGARRAQYERASPMSYVDQKIPPLLLIYGETDNQVEVSTADRFVEALGRAGCQDISYLRLAAVGHCPHSIARVPYLREVVDSFFARTLKLATQASVN